MTDPDPAPRPPPWRNPWIIALVVGMVTIPLIRPCTRHVPDPPAPIGAAPDWTLDAVGGGFVGSAALRGSVHILGIVGAGCASEACTQVLSGLRSLHEKYTAGDYPIRVVAVVAGGGAGDAMPVAAAVGGATVAFGPAGPLVSGLSALREGEDPDPSDLGLVLVDGAGRVRGFYATDEAGVDEAMHRATHVLREERAR